MFSQKRQNDVHNTTNNRGSSAACKEGCVPRWSHLGEIVCNCSCPSMPIGLGLDRSTELEATLDHTSGGQHCIQAASTMWLPEELQGKLHMQEGSITVYSPMSVQRTRLSLETWKSDEDSGHSRHRTNGFIRLTGRPS